MNTFFGNGAATSTASPTATNSNNFGLGLLGVSQNNVVENNRIVGNINGFYLGGGGQVTGNIIRRNIIVANPPAQVSNTFGSAIGADIQDFSDAGANTFRRNYCLTYAGVGPSPCPNISGPNDGASDDGDNADQQESGRAAFRAASPLQLAFRSTDFGSLLDGLWLLLRPSVPQKNLLGRSRRAGDALFDRLAAGQ